MLVFRVVTAFVLVLFPILVLAGNDSPKELSHFVDGDGRLLLPQGFSGSLDVEGYRLVTDSDGSPRFVETSTRGDSSGDWLTFGGLSTGCNHRVSAIVAGQNNVLYLGGRFTVCGDIAVNYVAGLDLSTGNFFALGEGLNNGVDKAVNSLAIDGSDLYVGGDFREAGGQSANRVARWDGSSWHALGTGADNGVNSNVFALAVLDSELYAGGFFSSAGGQTASRVARWDGMQWHSLGDGSANGVNNTVFTLASSSSEIYAGGFFTEAGGQVVNHVARWNGTAWFPLSNGGGTGVNNVVEALVVAGNDVFVGGGFTEAGGGPANRIARWDGMAWHSLTEAGNNGVNNWALH